MPKKPSYYSRLLSCTPTMRDLHTDEVLPLRSVFRHFHVSSTRSLGCSSWSMSFAHIPGVDNPSSPCLRYWFCWRPNDQCDRPVDRLKSLVRLGRWRRHQSARVDSDSVCLQHSLSVKPRSFLCTDRRRWPVGQSHDANTGCASHWSSP